MSKPDLADVLHEEPAYRLEGDNTEYPLPPLLTEFANAFDRGDYPELIIR